MFGAWVIELVQAIRCLNIVVSNVYFVDSFSGTPCSIYK